MKRLLRSIAEEPNLELVCAQSWRDVALQLEENIKRELAETNQIKIYLKIRRGISVAVFIDMISGNLQSVKNHLYLVSNISFCETTVLFLAMGARGAESCNHVS